MKLLAGWAAAVALLVTLVVGVPSTVASPPAEATGPVETVVESAPTPPLPSTSSLPSPPGPVAAPAASQEAPSAPVEPPTESAADSHGVAGLPNGVTKPSNAGGDLPVAGGTVDSTEESVDEVVREVTGERRPSPASHDSPGPVSRRQAAQNEAPAESGALEHSIGSAKLAPIARFFAYVWPAVALGLDRRLPTTLYAQLDGIDSLQLSKVTQALLGLAGGTQAGDNSPLGRPSETLNRPSTQGRQSAAQLDAALSTGVKILLYAAMAGLLAALALTVWTEFSAATRLPGR